VLRDEFRSGFVVEGSVDSSLDVVERSFAESAAGFRDGHNDGQILTAGFLFCSEAQFAENHGLSQVLFGGVVGGRNSLVMYEDKQTVAYVARTSTGFRGLRGVAQGIVVKCVEDFTAEPPIVTIRRGPLNAFRLQSVPVTDQFLSGFLSSDALQTADLAVGARRSRSFDARYSIERGQMWPGGGAFMLPGQSGAVFL
jgi:hypothetical protein